jgi:hypothetical protein
MEEKESKRICEKCHEKPTISANCPYCAGCMARMSHEKRKTSNHTSKPKKSQPRPDLSLTVDFSDHASLLTDLRDLASREIRTPGQQIIYLLKVHLSAHKSA